MALAESLRRLDERVYGPPEKDLARGIRYLPWLLAAALITEVLTVVTDSDALHPMLMFFLSGSLLSAIAIARGTRSR